MSDTDESTIFALSSNDSSSRTGASTPPDRILYYEQFKCHPPDPNACWPPWFLNFDGRFENLVREALTEVSFLEYVILCRTASIRCDHPGDYSAIIFMKENCLGTARKASVVYVENELLDLIAKKETLMAMYLFPMERDEGIFRDPEREQIFQRPLSAGRSEDKLAHTVKNFLMLDAVMARMVSGSGRPMMGLAESAME
jgi:hypothetical protein